MPLYSSAEMDEFDRKYDDAIEALANARVEIERLRAALKQIYDAKTIEDAWSLAEIGLRVNEQLTK